MKATILALAIAATIAPLAAAASEVPASLVPDGTYTVQVERVNDARHIQVKMDNGVETTLPAKNAVDFSKVKTNDMLMVSIIGGCVPVFKVK